jgi:hypothetical protein
VGRAEVPSSYADFVSILGDKSLSRPVKGLVYLYFTLNFTSVFPRCGALLEKL